MGQMGSFLSRLPRKPASETLPKLLASGKDADEIIQARIKEGQLLRDRQIDLEPQLETVRDECENWSRYNETLLSRLQLFDNTLMVDEYIKFSSHIYVSPRSEPPSFSVKLGWTQKEMDNSITSLEKIRAQLELPDEPSENPTRIFGDEVFIVHGHDEAAKHAIARFVAKFDIEPTILDEQVNRGQTIIDKFEEHAGEAGFAIVLLTPDDVGKSEDETDDPKPRARQNVILELGYFLCGLGRERVCVLYKEGVELPSDIHGILYVLMDNSDEWQLKLGQEMQAAGLPVDLNKLGKSE
jgi:predicted nucleotide-binding protein